MEDLGTGAESRGEEGVRLQKKGIRKNHNNYLFVKTKEEKIYRYA